MNRTSTRDDRKDSGRTAAVIAFPGITMAGGSEQDAVADIQEAFCRTQLQAKNLATLILKVENSEAGSASAGLLCVMTKVVGDSLAEIGLIKPTSVISWGRAEP